MKTVETQLIEILNKFKENKCSIERTVDILCYLSDLNKYGTVCKCGCASFNYAYNSNHIICTRCGESRKNH